jgi:hypothetical protein
MSFDLERILESKRALRRRLAARPIAEKLQMLDALRERALAGSGGGWRMKRSSGRLSRLSIRRKATEQSAAPAQSRRWKSATSVKILL